MMSSVIEDESRDQAEQQLLREVLIDISRGKGEQELALAKLALKQDGLLSVYKDHMQSADAHEKMASMLPHSDDVEPLIEIYHDAQLPKQHWNSVWYREIARALQVELKLNLQNPTMEPQQVIDQLNKKLEDLKASYGY